MTYGATKPAKVKPPVYKNIIEPRKSSARVIYSNTHLIVEVILVSLGEAGITLAKFKNMLAKLGDSNTKAADQYFVWPRDMESLVTETPEQRRERVTTTFTKALAEFEDLRIHHDSLVGTIER